MNAINSPPDFQNYRKKEMTSIVERKEMMTEKRDLGELQEKLKGIIVVQFRLARSHMVLKVL